MVHNTPKVEFCSKEFKSLRGAYLNQRPIHHQREGWRKVRKFCNKLNKEAMGILYHERRMGMQNGDHAWKDYLGNSNTDAIEKVNEINGLFFPKLARHMKHPLPHNSELVCIKLGQVAQEIFQQGYGKNAQVVFDELMNCSIRIKRWCEEDKIRLHVREIEGKKTIGFNFPNYDGTKGGFVAASCHFHNAGQIFVHDSAMVLGHTCFARHVTIYRSTIIDCYHLENVFISNSILKNVSTINARISKSRCKDANIYESDVSSSSIKGSAVERSKIVDSLIYESKIISQAVNDEIMEKSLRWA